LPGGACPWPDFAQWRVSARLPRCFNYSGLLLIRIGDNLFTETLASGQAVVGSPGTGGRGTLSGGALDLSNVDIAAEFANLIVAQRAFEANAKAETTFDQITQDTINLKQG
jgi:flagellar hook protein FlgE